MSAKANNFKLGLFILLALTLAAGAVFSLGINRLFQERVVLETYLNESVQGLEVGSKVKFRGVPVGSVSEIDFTWSHYQLTKPVAARLPYVRIQIEVDPQTLGGGSAGDLVPYLKKEVDRGLRTRLTSQGLTGLAYLEVDYADPRRNPPLPIDWQPAHYYIPSAPSTLTRFINSAEEVFKKLETIDLATLATNVNQLVLVTTRKVEEAPVQNLSSNANRLIAEFRQLNQDVRQKFNGPEISSLTTNAAAGMAALRRLIESPDIPSALAQLHQTLRRLEELTSDKDEDLQVTLGNLRQITDHLRQLTENARRYPAQILFGEPPKPRRRSE